MTNASDSFERCAGDGGEAVQPALPALPAAARSKMISIAADALARVPSAHVPPALRRSASFAPAKRARLIGGQLATVLESDDEFRSHLAVQVRALCPQAAADVEAGVMTDRADRIEAAALAYLLRPDGWEVTVAASHEVADESPSDARLAATVDRLDTALTAARGEAKAARVKAKAQLEDLKAENAQLRRTLGLTRTQLKEAVAAAAETSVSLDAAERSATYAARAAESESRRLRSRIAALESGQSAARRAVRDEHAAEAMRLRLLLETVVEAASGLRRELGLPPSELLPADTVSAVEPATDPGTSGVGRALLVDDPALLRRLLELPRVHLIIDGYNVSKTAWPSLPLDQQRSRLTTGVGTLTAGRGMETTVVFDGAELIHPPVVVSPRGVRVRFSPPGVIADDLIRQLVEAEPVGRPVVVVSTDREVAASITKMGARSVASLALLRAMGHRA